MVSSKYKIMLDFHAMSSPAILNVKRGDTGRKLHIVLVDGGRPYRISEDCYAVFTAKKPDGNIVYNPCEVAGNTIIYELTPQTVAAEGFVECEVKLYGNDDKLITSAAFGLLVNKTVYNEGDDIESSGEFSAIKASFVTPKMFGAAADGVTDDTNALLSCVEHCRKNNKLLYIPQDTTILIPDYTIVTGLKQIEIRGKIKAPNGIEFRYNSNLAGNEWYFNHIEGALTLSGLKDALITVIYASSLILLADSSVQNIGSIAYCQFVLGYVKTITLQGGENGGWINENFFYGGRVRDLTLNGSYSHNNNHFYNNSFENAKLVFNTGRSNYIHNARFEGGFSATFNGNAGNNYVHCAWTGETIPGNISKPGVSWNDEKGLNYYYTGINPPLKVVEKKFTANSFNYLTDKMYPLSGKLHNSSYNNDMLRTDFIGINHAIGLNVSSDAKFFRPYVYLYDENKNQIMSEPNEYIFHGCTMTWNAERGYYHYGSASVGSWECSISRYALITGVDSGVAYIKITIDGYDSADFDYFSFNISVPWYVNISPFESDRLTATAIPAAGEWTNGLIAYNTNPGKSCLGWIYNNGAWHETGDGVGDLNVKELPAVTANDNDKVLKVVNGGWSAALNATAAEDVLLPDGSALTTVLPEFVTEEEYVAMEAAGAIDPNIPYYIYG